MGSGVGTKDILGLVGVIKKSHCIVLDLNRLRVKSYLCLCDFINTMGF